METRKGKITGNRADTNSSSVRGNRNGVITKVSLYLFGNGRDRCSDGNKRVNGG